MTWWLVMLIVAGSVVLGVAVGIVLGRVLSRLRHWTSSEKDESFVTGTGLAGGPLQVPHFNHGKLSNSILSKSTERAPSAGPTGRNGVAPNPIPGVIGMAKRDQVLGAANVKPQTPTEISEKAAYARGERALPGAAIKQEVSRQEADISGGVKDAVAGSKAEEKATPASLPLEAWPSATAAEASRTGGVNETKSNAQGQRLDKERVKQILVEMVEKAAAERAKQAAERVDRLQAAGTQGKQEPSRGLLEIQTNLRIAVTPWSGTPLPFETRVWDTNSSEFDSLGTQHREDLAQAYVDMSLANQIVWVWTELGSASKDLELSYRSLCSKIAERLTQWIKRTADRT